MCKIVAKTHSTHCKMVLNMQQDDKLLIYKLGYKNLFTNLPKIAKIHLHKLEKWPNRKEGSSILGS
jgi:hypothetical protein